MELEPGISLCMIVKDEANHLRDCLNSVKNLVDEMIIVDTGSSDFTKEIAKEFTDRVFDFKWDDDFADARNFSISKAIKEWILVLDADEIISERDIERIKELSKNIEADACFFDWRNYSNETGSMDWVSSENDAYTESKVARGFNVVKYLRFFRNGKGFLFEGRIHETIQNSVKQKNARVIYSDIVIHHFGGLDSSRDMKRQRNLLLLKSRIDEKDFKEKTEDYVYFEYAKALLAVKRYEESVEYFKKAIELNEDVEYLSALGGVLILSGRDDEAERILKKALTINSNNPSDHSNLGVIYARQGNFEKAIKKFERAIEINPMDADSYFNIGLAYEEKGKSDRARFFFNKAVELNPEYAKKMQD